MSRVKIEPPDLPTLLRNTLASLRMRQVQLAIRTGVSEKHISMIAQGRARISMTVALRFERATNVHALTWMLADAVSEERALRRRPRVWWSASLGVIEQLLPDKQPFLHLRVSTNTLLDELPCDAVELLPAEPSAVDYGGLRPPPPGLVDEFAERLRPYRLQFGPSTCERFKNGATSTFMNGGEREYLAREALMVVAQAYKSGCVDGLRDWLAED